MDLVNYQAVLLRSEQCSSSDGGLPGLHRIYELGSKFPSASLSEIVKREDEEAKISLFSLLVLRKTLAQENVFYLTSVV